MTARGGAVTVGCAVAGAVIGVLPWGADLWRSALVVATGAVFGTVLALGVLTTGRRPRLPAVPSPQPTPPPSPHRTPRPTPEPVPTPAAVGPRPAADRTWWTEARPTAPPTVHTGRADDGYEVDRAVVAQCPRCGDFRLDVAQHGDGYAFHCRNPNCGHRWEWRPDAPWPTTVVRRNLTR
ncbi:hypothetical protein ACFXGA_21235 [Actinosynnema sp. NPDC059335]|uniref:hypothetical protein n=1 Tax=Actinosynnema sp. NPDC059335 TaxID=3346804 RepID=UPI00366E4A03